LITLNVLSIKALPTTIRAKLEAKEALKSSERSIVVQAMARQLIDHFERPGTIGATAQWCYELVAK